MRPTRGAFELTDDPQQTSWERFLDELAGAGYEWLELGLPGFLPTDPVRLREEVGRRGLKVSGGTVAGSLHRAEAWDSDVAIAASSRIARPGDGCPFPRILFPEAYRDQQGNFIQDPSLEPDDWKRLVSCASEIGRIVLGDYGVRLVFHPHADSHVGTQEEVERFLEETDPSAVSLCLDTGHISYCGGDNLALIENFIRPVGYVHFSGWCPTCWLRCGAKILGFP